MGTAHRPGLITSSAVHYKDTGQNVGPGLYEVDATIEFPAQLGGQFGGVAFAAKLDDNPPYGSIPVPLSGLDVEYIWTDSWLPHVEKFKVTLPEEARYVFGMLYF